MPNSNLLDVSPPLIQNLVPSSTYHIYVECRDLRRRNTLQFQTRDLYLTSDPDIDDEGDDPDLVLLASMSIKSAAEVEKVTPEASSAMTYSLIFALIPESTIYI